MNGRAITRRRPFGENPRVGERGSETEKRILDAALEVFGEMGFSEARVESITHRAGCSRPAFYQYYSSKEQVFWKLARDLAKQMIALGKTLEPVTPDEAGVATLTDWLETFTDLYLAYAPVFSAFQAATHDNPEIARESGSVGDRLDDALLRAFDAPTDATTRALASGMAAIIIRCNFYWRSMVTTGPMERSRLLHGLATATHRLFHGPIVGVNVEKRAAHRPDPDSLHNLFTPPDTGTTEGELKARGQATRRKILAAGAEILPVRGYHDARVDDIAKAAGVSHGTFYRYFNDKDDFFRALGSEATSGMIDLLRRLPLDDDTDALREWLAEWFELYRSNGGVITAWQEMQESNGDLEPYSREVAATIVLGLSELLESHGHTDALFDTLMLLALVERLPYRTFSLGYTTLEDAIDAGTTIIRRSILGVAA